MSFAWFVALRYLLDARGQTTLILSAVSVGVAVVVFLSALITGLQASLVDKTLGAQAHVTLRVPREAPRALVEASLGHAVARVVQPAPQRLRSIEGWPAVMADAERTAGVTAVSPMVVGAGFAVRSDAKQAVVLLGVIPERHRAIVDVERHLDAGRLDVTGARAVVGSSLARDLAVTIGDKIHVTTTEGVSDVLTVAGIFTLGNQGVDRTWVITSLRQAQALYRLPGGATTLELKVADVFDAERVAIDLHGRTGLDADSWMTLNAALLSGLSAQSSSRALIEFFIVIAVALGIASVLAVSVVQKSREIGILRAVGTPARRPGGAAGAVLPERGPRPRRGAAVPHAPRRQPARQRPRHVNRGGAPGRRPPRPPRRADRSGRGHSPWLSPCWWSTRW